MKVIAINGSPKYEGNTYQSLNIVGDEIKAAGIDFEILHIGHKNIHGCIGCRKCATNRDEKCTLRNDDLNQYLQQIKAVDGIILGSPVYYSGVAGTMKCFLDRLFYVSGANGNLFRHKVGAAVVAVRRSGGSSTLDCLNHYFSITEMLVANSNYWNIIHGRDAGEVLKDGEGVQTMRILGKNMVWLLKMKEATATTILPPQQEMKEITNFIR